MGLAGGGFFGSGGSSSESWGGPTNSADTFAYNNAQAAAPVFNYTDSRKASGKHANNWANNIRFNIQTTDYGAIAGALQLADNSLYYNNEAMQLIESGSRELAQTSREISAYAADSITNNLNSALMFAETQSMPDKGVFQKSALYVSVAVVALGGLNYLAKRKK